MAKEGPTPTCVSGFVKQTKIQGVQKKMLSFVVVEKIFWLPYDSTFAMTVRQAKREEKNVIILFKEMDGAAPEVTGVIVSPKWSQRKAAEDGATFEELKAM